MIKPEVSEIRVLVFLRKSKPKENEGTSWKSNSVRFRQ